MHAFFQQPYVPPPEPPIDVAGFINGDGAVELRWKGTLAHATFYEILRKVDDETSWNLISSVGDKKFLDDTLSGGCTGVQYRVRAKRGNTTSASSDPIVFRLGVEPENTTLGIAAYRPGDREHEARVTASDRPGLQSPGRRSMCTSTRGAPTPKRPRAPGLPGARDQTVLRGW